MADLRAEQVARNEAHFRDLNAALDKGLEGSPRLREETGFICECGRPACGSLVHVPLAKYEEVRSDARRFLIAPGHEILEVEDVVEEGERHSVVRKFLDVIHIVEPTDPRRDD